MRTWRSGSQRGTSTLEFLAVLPVLLFIFLGGLELSRAWFTATIATNAAREGARVAVAMGPVDPASPSFTNAKTAGEQRIDDILTAANLCPVNSGGARVSCALPGGSTSSWSVDCQTNECPPDSQVTSSVTINFVTVSPGFLSMLGTPSDPLVLSEISKMRRE